MNRVLLFFSSFFLCIYVIMCFVELAASRASTLIILVGLTINSKL
jgi:hypothetical protein